MTDLEEAFPDIISSDAGWKLDTYTSYPKRGILDYYRHVIAKRELTKEELPAIIAWLKKNKCPGWTGVLIGGSGRWDHITESSTFSYTFRTTMDSSD